MAKWLVTLEERMTQTVTVEAGSEEEAVKTAIEEHGYMSNWDSGGVEAVDAKEC